MDKAENLEEKSPLTMVGLMSGTSMDGLDICVADIEFVDDSVDFEIVASGTVRFPHDLRRAIGHVLSGRTAQVCETHYELGRFYAEATVRFLAENDISTVDAVAVHGQTIHHVSGVATLQIGEPSFLAEVVGAPVVSDFRARDISVGGTGAPLIPIVDKWLYQGEKDAVISVNIGGIANVAYLPPTESGQEIIGFDTGPGMALLDEASRLLLGKPYDVNGQVASQGTPDDREVESWLADEFVVMPPPKSTGRDYFGARWLERNIRNIETRRPDDLLASLSLFTARCVVVNCEQFIQSELLSQVVVSGGGVHHRMVMAMLKKGFDPIPVISSQALGIDPDMKEALGFALLGAAYFRGIPGNVPSATGARKAVVLGKLTV